MYYTLKVNCIDISLIINYSFDKNNYIYIYMYIFYILIIFVSKLTKPLTSNLVVHTFVSLLKSDCFNQLSSIGIGMIYHLTCTCISRSIL